MMRKKTLMALTGIAALVAGGMVYSSESSEQNTENKQQKTMQQGSHATTQASREDITRVSEAFGHYIGRNLNSPGLDFDVESIIRGLRNGAAGKPSPVDEAEYEALMGRLQAQAYKNLSEINLRNSVEFFQKIATQDNVKELESGKLYYEVLTVGTGPMVDEHGTPLVSYSGKFIDGSQSGSSEEVGGPITIPLDQTIAGFRKGIAGMKEGEKRRLFVHPDAGYGSASSHMPPNSTLIFEVEVVKAVSPDTSESDDEDSLLPLAIEEDMSESDEDELSDPSREDKDSGPQDRY